MMLCSDCILPLPGRRSGKVRECYSLPGDLLLMVTTDRISAFDRVLGSVPYKGQVLNQLSGWWLERTRSVVPNHFVEMVDPQAMVVRAARPLPLEVVVRGYITGVTKTSLWTLYSQGRRQLYGHLLPEGLVKDQALPTPLVTPTTKAAAGGHDEPIAASEAVARGLVSAALWQEIQDAALGLFAEGTRRAAAAGLILVDTKYEFGLDQEGRLLLIDELHTPDSSRYWDHQTRESLDKEHLRQAYARLGYRGEGDPPPLEESLALEVSQRYQEVYRRLTGESLRPAAGDCVERLQQWIQQR